MPGKDGKLRCLALAGGGVRGVLSAHILAWIERQTGKPISQSFEIVAGTSTGALIALALTKPNPLTAEQCVGLYTQHGKTIFSRSAAHAALTLNGYAGPKYDGVGLRSVLNTTFGTATLEEASIPTLAMTYCLSQRMPSLQRSWQPTGAPRPLVDVGLATSAAPTYFPPATLQGQVHIDGGVVANDPALSGLIELCKLNGAHVRDCSVLSIGTGINKSAINPAKARGWGKLGWVEPLIDIMLDGVPDLTDAQLSDLMPSDQYLHLDAPISAQDAAMDDANPAHLSRLEAIAEKVIDAQKGPLLALLDRM